MRVVVDTNVVVSHYITPAAHAARVLLAWQAQQFDLITSEPILAEVARSHVPTPARPPPNG